MTDLIAMRLDDLATSTEMPPLDLEGIRLAARRRILRKRVMAALAALVLVGFGLSGAVLFDRHDREALQPAEPGSTTPTEARLVRAVEKAFPGTRIREINRIPAGPMTPGGSPYYAPGRSLVADELWFIDAHTAAGDALSVHWYVLDPPLTDDEADRYARGIFPPDPDPVPPPAAVRLPTEHDNSGSLKSLLYTYDQRIHSYAWSTTGPLVTADLSAVSGDVTRAQLLDELTRALAGPGPSKTSSAAVLSLADFSRLADLSRLPESGATVGDITGPRLVGCVSLARAVALANRDFTADLAEEGRPISPTAIVRVVADGTVRAPDRMLTLRATVLLDATTGHVLSTGTQQVVLDGPKLAPRDSLRADEQPCPGGGNRG